MDIYIRKAVENGKVIFPKKFCLTNADKGDKKVESIEQLRTDLIPSEFAALYLNDPIDSDAIEFKPDWFTHTNDFNPWREAQCLMSIDPAFRLKETNDFTGITVSRINQDERILIPYADQKKLNADDLVNEIIRVAKIFNPSKIIIETVAAQIVLLTVLREAMRKASTWFVVEEVKPSTKETKAMRIRALVPYYANQRIVHGPGLKLLENQLVEFPRGLHDDIIDSLANHVPYWKAPSRIGRPTTVEPGSWQWWKNLAKKKQTNDKLFEDFRRI